MGGNSWRDWIGFVRFSSLLFSTASAEASSIGQHAMAFSYIVAGDCLASAGIGFGFGIGIGLGIGLGISWDWQHHSALFPTARMC